MHINPMLLPLPGIRRVPPVLTAPLAQYHPTAFTFAPAVAMHPITYLLLLAVTAQAHCEPGPSQPPVVSTHPI